MLNCQGLHDCVSVAVLGHFGMGAVHYDRGICWGYRRWLGGVKAVISIVLQRVKRVGDGFLCCGKPLLFSEAEARCTSDGRSLYFANSRQDLQFVGCGVVVCSNPKWPRF